MAKLIYSAISSLDGYVADEDGNFDWAAPDEEVHAFINDLDRPLGTYLYGRRMYETMVGWETDPTLAEQSPQMQDFVQIWHVGDPLPEESPEDPKHLAEGDRLKAIEGLVALTSEGGEIVYKPLSDLTPEDRRKRFGAEGEQIAWIVARRKKRSPSLP